MLEILGKVGFDWQVALANLINFGLVFIVLNFLVFKPLKKVIQERKEKIDAGLSNAERAKEVLQEASFKKDDLLRDAYKESQDIIGKAKEERSKIISSAGDDANEEASKIRQNALEEADMILKKADEDITYKAVGVILSGVEKVLKAKMTKDINEKYVKSLLQ